MTQNENDTESEVWSSRGGDPSSSARFLTEIEEYRKSHALPRNLGQYLGLEALGALESLKKLRNKSISDRNLVFTSVAHHLTIGMLTLSFCHLRRDAATGLDKVTVEEYRKDLEKNLRNLRYRIVNDKHRFTAVRRTYIPKASGGERPLGICVTEDKIVQGAVKLILEAIYEPTFSGLSYGFRPVTRAHDGLDALCVAIESRNVNYILDADIVGCFDNINKDILMEILRLKVTDRRMLRLIRRMLSAGILDRGTLKYDENGVTQGAIASPILCNIFLDHVLDKFFTRWRSWHFSPDGDSCMVRYADDFICGFETEGQANRFLEVLEDRLLCAGLRLHKDKTRLVKFGRKAWNEHWYRGEDKPGTFKFLGFEFICSNTFRKRRFKLVRHTIPKRLESKIQEIGASLRKILLSGSVENALETLNSRLRGYYAYFAVHENIRTLSVFRYRLAVIFHKLLNRRSQKGYFSWEKFNKYISNRIALPVKVHRYPSQRFSFRQGWLSYARSSAVLYACLQPPLFRG